MTWAKLDDQFFERTHPKAVAVEPIGTRVRDTEAGRIRIAAEIERLRQWAERQGEPWAPAAAGQRELSGVGRAPSGEVRPA